MKVTPRSSIVSAAAGLLLVLALAVAGCAGPAGMPPTKPGAPVTAMAAAERASRLPTGFPEQVPVPAGTVVAMSGAQAKSGRGVWTYTMDVATNPETLASWYTQGLTALNWDPQSPQGAPGSSSIDREFVKGEGGQILLRIAPTKDGRARVVASVSIGVPVTPAQ